MHVRIGSVLAQHHHVRVVLQLQLSEFARRVLQDPWSGSLRHACLASTVGQANGMPVAQVVVRSRGCRVTRSNSHAQRIPRLLPQRSRFASPATWRRSAAGSLGAICALCAFSRCAIDVRSRSHSAGVRRSSLGPLIGTRRRGVRGRLNDCREGCGHFSSCVAAASVAALQGRQADPTVGKCVMSAPACQFRSGFVQETDDGPSVTRPK